MTTNSCIRKLAWVVFSSAAISVLGCGPPKPPEEKLVPVSGSVTIDGHPEAGIIVKMVPIKDNSTSHGGNAITDASGNFTIKNYMNLDGLSVGDYTILFSKIKTADGKDPPKFDPSKKTAMAGVFTVETIAPKWSSLSKASFHNAVKIPEGGKKDLKYAITSIEKK